MSSGNNEMNGRDRIYTHENLERHLYPDEAEDEEAEEIEMQKEEEE